MKPVQVTEKILGLFPEGSMGIEIGLPEELAILPNTIPTMQGVAISDENGELTPARAFIFEFENHDEWKDFKTNRKLIIFFPLGNVAPISIGAFRVVSKEGKQVFENETFEQDQN